MQQNTEEIAKIILEGFDRHYKILNESCDEIISCFREQRWQSIQKITCDRLLYFQQRVEETIQILSTRYTLKPFDAVFWYKIKTHYVGLLYSHQQPELAETFYNSIFCKLFEQKYFNNNRIFMQPAIATNYVDMFANKPLYNSILFSSSTERNISRLSDLLKQIHLPLPFADLENDCQKILVALEQRRSLDKLEKNSVNAVIQVQLLTEPMYRNHSCYIIGKIVKEETQQPIVIPLKSNKDNQLIADALLTKEQHIANIFSTSRSYFVLKSEQPAATIRFLKKIVPRRNVSELYSGIGLHKQAKTEFYRFFLYHIKHSSDSFSFAKGTPGMVMCVFTLPSFPYVFKIIRDKILPPKTTTERKVKSSYQLVKEHDRVGRMIDVLEFSDVCVPLDRVKPELLAELQDQCANKTRIDYKKNELMLSHVYVERRLSPLNLYLQNFDGKKRHQLLDDYANCISQLAAANIFTGDIFFKNFGVNRNQKVFFYDFDEIDYVTNLNFRKIPEPMTYEQEMASEPWYNVADNDIFPEEFGRFVFSNKQDKQYFEQHHGHLFTADYWINQQQRIHDGVIEKVYSYPKNTLI